MRLGLPEFLPGIGNIVYLDADTLCLEDVGALFDTDLGDAPIAASLDPPMVNLVAYERQRGRGPSPRSATRYLKHELGLGDAMTRYFNSGVLVLDLDRLRTDTLMERAKEVLSRMGSRLRLDDQCVLNALYAATYHQLPARWNAMLCLEPLRSMLPPACNSWQELPRLGTTRRCSISARTRSPGFATGARRPSRRCGGPMPLRHRCPGA